MTDLCIPFAESYLDSGEFTSFFTPDEQRRIRHSEDRAELPIVNGTCRDNLFFGFFFDGTKNNYKKAAADNSFSNVARLYDCYPGLSVAGVLDKKTDWEGAARNFYRVYIPGVSTEFGQVGDPGSGVSETRGGAFGYLGEARIVWALIQSINNVHRYFHQVPLVSPDEEKKLVHKISLLASQRPSMTQKTARSSFSLDDWSHPSLRWTREQFEPVLRRLHKAISQHWPDKSGRPPKLEPAIVQKIFISIFGFSRGATQARAFANWLVALCRLDATLSRRGGGGLTLGGFDVSFDFLGLFDTVASVGLGNTAGDVLIASALDGHSEWAESETNLRIPAEIPCLHLVAAHEVRRSFPVDSVSVGAQLPANCTEVVFPGVHSDVGGGYCPREQGRGTDAKGADMLSRFPLLYMYRIARLAGVPLKLEKATNQNKEKFRITPSAREAMNAYLSHCKVTKGTVTAIMREQAKLAILWRKSRRPSANLPIDKTASFGRAATFDQNDLHSANLEFDQEIALFQAWRKEQGKGFVPKTQEPGFDDSHAREWEEIATWWDSPPPPPAVLSFFDDYVHDSRAWFKLYGPYPDSEAKMIKNLEDWEKRRTTAIRVNEINREIAEGKGMAFAMMRASQASAGMVAPIQQSDGLTPAQREAAIEYARTKKLPRMVTSGREPYDMGYGIKLRAGYLRFRKVYAGADDVLLSHRYENEPGQEDTAVA